MRLTCRFQQQRHSQYHHLPLCLSLCRRCSIHCCCLHDARGWHQQCNQHLLHPGLHRRRCLQLNRPITSTLHQALQWCHCRYHRFRSLKNSVLCVDDSDLSRSDCLDCGVRGTVYCGEPVKRIIQITELSFVRGEHLRDRSFPVQRGSNMLG